MTTQTTAQTLSIADKALAVYASLEDQSNPWESCFYDFDLGDNSDLDDCYAVRFADGSMLEWIDGQYQVKK